MNRFTLPLRLAPLFAALVLAGCAALPQAPTVASVDVPARFANAVPATAPTAGTADTWAAFADPTLDALQRRAQDNNTSVQAAAARLAQARALLRGTQAERAPQIGAQASAQSGASGRAPASERYGLGVGLSYEVDLSGRLARASDAATLDARAREALLRDTVQQVQADVARSYLALRAIDNERSLVRETVAAYADSLRLLERRVAAGDVAELDLARLRSELAANEAEALALERRRAELQNALALLVGEPASTFQLAAAPWSATLPAVPAGLPSQMLARRPDLAAAQSRLQAAQARVGIAQSAWLPSFTLTAQGGVASPQLSDLLRTAASSWGVGALLALPIFDGGRRDAAVAQAQAEAQGAAVALRENTLVALREVEDQLSALRLLGEQALAQERAVAASGTAVRLSDARYRNGLVSQLEVLDARRTDLSQRRQALQVRAAQAQATVGLVRALGGGWGAA